ncbi:unnamed protein product [Rotaria socialis]|uniref:Uncharacterized protein n=1 Tax=Rotaria socialis TaxID=392032 RepID=A0A820MNG4_9BILA|nr:unnamed protein product [Rotaria socialis]
MRLHKGEAQLTGIKITKFCCETCPLTTPTVTTLQSTPPVPSIPLCSINATWKREGVTVAGFFNSTADSSLSGLYYPEEIVVDPVGNLYILDFLNRRILYWPTNSTEGRSIAGTRVSDAEPNQLRSPHEILCLSLSSFRVVSKGRLYTFDSSVLSIVWFPLNISGGSPNRTIVKQCNPDGTNITLSSIVIAFDGVRKLFYITGYENPSLIIIMNITDDCMVMITKSTFTLTNGLMLEHPCSILVDETSGSFYVLDMALKIMAKYSFGSTTGTIIISGLLNNMDSTGYGSCGKMGFDSSGQLYMTDSGQFRVVQLVNDKGGMRTVAGMGFAGNSNKRLQYPKHFGFDAHHNLYVSDSPNHRVQRFDLLNNGC